MDWRIPLSDIDFDDTEALAVRDVIKSRWLTMGKVTQEFESSFAKYTQAKHAIAVTNATAALHLACLALGIGPGDEVIVPSLTFVATANAVRYVGATPIFADIAGRVEPWMAASACEAAIGPATRAILHMAYGGHPGE